MPNWIIASTVSAPSWQIILHARYHSNFGAKKLIYFLDSPQKHSNEELELLSRYAEIILCNHDYWDAQGGKPPNHTTRQLINLQFARKCKDAEWVLHIDIDEFLYLPSNNFNDVFSLPPEIAEVRIENVERVLTYGSNTWIDGYFRIKILNNKLLAKHYGPSAGFFGLGLSNYFHGKSLVKNRPRIIQNIHGAIHADAHKEIIRIELHRSEAIIVHYPCISPSHFVSRYLSFLKSGKYEISEFQYQQLFRSHLFNESRRLGAKNALTKGLRELHYCTAAQALERLEDGLYEKIPEEFVSRLTESAVDILNINLAWADNSIARYYGLTSD